MQRFMKWIAAAVLCSSLDLMAQTATAPKFEVASVRLSDPKSNVQTSWEYENTNRFLAKRTPLRILVALAYQMSDNRIEGLPGWAGDALYDVSAKAEGGVLLTADTIMPMLQQLLVERLHLKAHRETKQVKGYVLVMGKGKPKLSVAPGPPRGLMILPNGVQAQGATIADVADLLSRPLGRPVKDKTGLTGTYDVKLSFAPFNDPDSTLPAPSAAIEEQMGLRLESTMVPTR